MRDMCLDLTSCARIRCSLDVLEKTVLVVLFVTYVLMKRSASRRNFIKGTKDDFCFFFFSSRRRHTRLQGDWSSDVCSSDLEVGHDLQRQVIACQGLLVLAFAIQ